MNIIKIGREYLAGKWGWVAAILALQLAQIIFSLFLPSINAAIIDDGILKKDIPTIWRLGGAMLGLTALQLICSVIAVIVSSRLSLDFGRRLRRDIFHHVQSFSETDRHKFGASTLITRTTNDTNQVQMVIMMTFTVIVTAPIMGIGGIIMAVRQNARLSLLLLIIVPVLAILVVTVMSKLAPLHASQQQRIDRTSGILRESLTGVRVIRAFNQQKRQSERFAEANETLRATTLKIGTLWSLLMPASSLIIGVSSAAIVWYGGHLIDKGSMEVGSLTAFISYLMMILGAVMMSGMMMMMLPRAAVSAARLQEVRETIPSIASPAKPLPLPAAPRSFVLDNAMIRFQDAEKPVLDNLNVRLSPHTTTAIVGSTGSGKSSLARLFPRLIDPAEGGVYIENTSTSERVDIRDLDLHELRQHIAFIPQTSFLFTGTIASNVAGKVTHGGENAERVQRALEIAQAWEFVSKLDDGIHAPVESGGKNFSGGQRQRLAIARALYRCLPDEDGKPKADLVIFDDSFSALDFTTDAALRAALRENLGDVTVLIVASRIATVRDADSIIVLDEGRVVGNASHEELMESCQTYQEIVQSQFSAEEVGA
ncbi:MAG: ABC transporter ATP-binding protein [Actinomycetaceae bacterium]|nr:ABC transporter ATP-binding protein [Actinomycetaceae bacterium]